MRYMASIFPVIANVLVLMGIGMCFSEAAVGQSFSPYSAFQAMSLSDLATLQMKLTYVGPQREVHQTIVATASGNPPNIGLFVPFQRSGISYGNDLRPIFSFYSSPTELQVMIADVGQLSSVTAGGVSASPYLSFALLNTAGGTKAFEAVLNITDSGSLFGQLRAAFAGNTSGLQLISNRECSMGILEPGAPTNVSSQVSVALSGVRLNRANGMFTGSAAVTNTSGSSITGPITLVLQLPSGITLFNAQGSTCAILPQGRPLFNLPVGSLSPGASTQVTLQFVNPNAIPITFVATVFAGLGGR
jgi:hypothetical protein